MAVAPGNRDIASKLKLRTLTEQMSWINAMHVRSVFDSVGGDMDRARATLRAVYPPPAGFTATTPASPPRRAGPAVPSGRRKTPVAWVETGALLRRCQRWALTHACCSGSAVATEYAKHRSEAIEHALARNKFFQVCRPHGSPSPRALTCLHQRATEAFRNGDGALARQMSLQGRWHNEQMAMLHARASEKIFASRNAALGGAGAQVIDLHGLHVQ